MSGFRKLGAFQRAIQDATKAIEIDPKFAEAYRQRAFAYQQSQLDNRVQHNPEGNGSVPKRGSVGSSTNQVVEFRQTRRYRVSVLTRSHSG